MRTQPAPHAPLRIVIADDHRMFRESLRKLLEMEPDLTVVGEAGDGTAAVTLTRELRPDILLLDLAMPGMTGLEALGPLMAAAGETRVIMLTGTIEKRQIVDAMRLGVRGLVLKESATALLLKAIRVVMNGEYWIQRESLSDLLEVLRTETSSKPVVAPRTFGLTPRELQIIHAVVAAYANKDIAEKLAISEKTVKHHLTNIFDKVGVSNRLELALFALHHGLGVPDPPA